MKCLITVLTSALIYSAITQASELKALMKDDNFQEDARLAKLLHDYVFSQEHNWIGASQLAHIDTNHNSSDTVHNTHTLIHLWETEIIPLCDRFIKKYGIIFNKEEDLFQHDHKKHSHDEAKKAFSSEFKHDIFDHCVKFNETVEHFHNHDSQARKILPELLNQLDQIYRQSKGTSTIELSVFNHSSYLYKQRRKLEAKIKLALSWLHIDKDQPQSALLAKRWKTRHQQIEQAFKQLKDEYKFELLKISTLPSHAYQHHDDTPMQKRISKAFVEKYAVTPKHIIIREKNVRHNISRLIKKADTLQAQTYSALAFSAVIPQNDQRVSTHYGWIEFHTDGSREVFLEKEHDNFSNPKFDHIHTIGSRS